MPRVALVTTDPQVVADEEVDLPILLRELARVGVVAEAPVWHDSSVDWAGFDLIVMRSPWDYPERLEEFLAWLAAVREETEVLNCPDLIRWNLDKAYLLEVAADGVPVVETHLCDSIGSVTAAIDQVESDQVVLKPNVSVGSRDTGRFDRTDVSGPASLAKTILGSGRRVLVQPGVPSVSREGEIALVYFDGELSHSLRKGPILALGGGFIGGTYTEEISAARASAQERALGDLAISAVSRGATRNGCSCADPTPLYARFDLVAGEAGPLLLEAELFEPSYFLGTSPGSEAAFSRALMRRLAAREASRRG